MEGEDREWRSGMDRRSGSDRRYPERRKGERRTEVINLDLILKGIAIRRSGLDRRQGERRKAERRRGERRAALSFVT
jgi:hypothetical protein